MDDTVSRAVAIDVMCELMRHWFGGDPKDEVREIKRELEKLPSVQPFHNTTMNEVLQYIDDISEDEWDEFTACLECRGWKLKRVRG